MQGTRFSARIYIYLLLWKNRYKTPKISKTRYTTGTTWENHTQIVAWECNFSAYIFNSLFIPLYLCCIKIFSILMSRDILLLFFSWRLNDGIVSFGSDSGLSLMKQAIMRTNDDRQQMMSNFYWICHRNWQHLNSKILWCQWQKPSYLQAVYSPLVQIFNELNPLAQ